MTETTHDDPAPPPPPPGSVPPRREVPRLVRDPDDAVLAGVCAAFGRYTDTDPVLWRVTVAVLTLFGGAGVVLYVLGWLLVPRRGESQSFAERTLRRPGRGLSAAGVVLVVVAAVVLLAALHDGPGLGALLVVGGIAYLVARERRQAQTAGAFPPPGTTAPQGTGAPASTTAAPPYDAPASSYGTDPSGGLGTTATFATAADPYASPAPRRRRPRSPLGALTVSAATLLTGVLLAIRLSGVDALTPDRIVAVALLVVGGGLLVGAFVGRARWLLPVGLVLSLVLAGTAAARNAGLAAGVGERTWTAVPGGTYSLGAGEAVLDLRRLDTGATVAAEVGVGTLTVLVPPRVRAVVDAEVQVGEIARVSGTGRRTVLTPDDETDLQQDFVVGPGDVTVELDLEVGMGQIEVRRVAA